MNEKKQLRKFKALARKRKEKIFELRKRLKEYIPNRVAANESVKRLNASKTLGMVCIAGFIIIAISSVYNKKAGSISAGIFSMGVVVYLYIIGNYTRYLQNKYKIAPKTPFRFELEKE